MIKKSYDIPKHSHFMEALHSLQTKDASNFRRILGKIEKVFLCQDPEELLDDEDMVSDASQYSVEFILKTVKWFFIEQDLTYWNGSGRFMLWKEIEKFRKI